MFPIFEKKLQLLRVFSTSRSDLGGERQKYIIHKSVQTSNNVHNVKMYEIYIN